MADSLETKWPPLNEAYRDELGAIDYDIYAAAGEIWPMAAALSKTVLHDESIGQVALLTVCARITESRAAERIQIKSLKGYIFQAYRYEILRLLQQRRLHDELSAQRYAVIEETQSADDVLKKILIEEIISRMDATNRQIFELRVLGHSFEDIARMVGKRSNAVRNIYSRQLSKIRNELEGL